MMRIWSSISLHRASCAASMVESESPQIDSSGTSCHQPQSNPTHKSNTVAQIDSLELTRRFWIHG
jgi:hypothetical protein